MNANNTQIGNTPLESLFEHNENESNLDQMLSLDILTTSQPLIEFTMNNMIPSQRQLINNVPEPVTVTRRQRQHQQRREHQEVQRRQRHRERQPPQRPQPQPQTRRQRRRQRRRQHQEEQRGRRQRERQLPSRPQQEQQARSQSIRGWFEHESDPEYWQYIGYPEYMEENNTQLLEAYDWEHMDPKDRSEQEQLNEIEGFVVLEQLLLIQDEIEQLHQIEVVQQVQADEEEQRNQEQLIQLQQWQDIEFLLQQLKSN